MIHDQRRSAPTFSLLTVFVLAIGSQAAAEEHGRLVRISVATQGGQANDHSYEPAISANGRYVAFRSWARTLVSNDTNGVADVFVHDAVTAETTRVSVSSNGLQANNFSDFAPAISADGRYVAFQSYATNLVPGDSNGHGDIFVHDRHTGETELVSVATDGTQANDSSFAPAISSDGRYVAFESVASNLVTGDTNACQFNVCPDIFVHDRRTGETTRVSLATNRAQANNSSYTPALAAGGRLVAFQSSATNLVPGDTNQRSDVFLHDRRRGRTTRVSVGNFDAQGNGETYGFAITPDGRFLAFGSASSNLVEHDGNGEADVFVRDLDNATTTIVSLRSNGKQGNGFSVGPSISADGRHVAFVSQATNFVPHDTNLCRVDDEGTFEPCPDIFLHDRATGTTRRVSVAATGEQADRQSDLPALSADGRFLAFESPATNLVPNDSNRRWDIFLRSAGASGEAATSTAAR